MLSTEFELKGRFYSWPKDPVVGVCIDGSEPGYIEEAVKAGVAPLSSNSAQTGLPLKAPEASFSIEDKRVHGIPVRNRCVMLWFVSTGCTSCIQAVQALRVKQPELEASGLLIVVLKNY